MKNVLRLVVVAIVLSTLLMGQATAAKTKLVWARRGGNVASNEITTNLAQQYMAQNPDVEIEVLFPSSSYYETLRTWIVGGTGADVMWLGTALWSFTDLLLPLNDLVTKDKNVASIYPQILKSGNWEGSQIGLPYGVNTNVMAYDKELWDTAGVAYPANNWTFSDAFSMGKKITKDTDGNGTTDIWFTGQFEYEPHMAEAGDFYSADGRRAAFNNPVAIEALKNVVDLNTGVHGICLPDTISSETTFLSKKLGMKIIGPFNLPNYRVQAKFDWDVVPWPGIVQNGKRYDSAFISLESWAINKDTKNPEEAKKFVAWLFQPENMKQWGKSGLVIPSQPQQASAFLSQGTPPKNLNAFIQTINYTHRYYYDHPHGSVIEDAFYAKDSTFLQMITGKIPVASAFPELEKQVNTLLDEYWAKRGK